MSRDLRMTSLYEVAPQPLWLRRLQWAGLTCEVLALTLMFCHLSFGLWRKNWWYVAAVMLLQLVFIGAQTTVMRRNRKQRRGP